MVTINFEIPSPPQLESDGKDKKDIPPKKNMLSQHDKHPR